MRDSTFAYTTQVGAAADPRLAMGHFEGGKAHAAVPIGVRPAAQFTTTAADMLRFARFVVGDGRIDGATFIEPALMRARARPAGTEAVRAGLPVGYALGLGLRDRDGAVGVCHGGDTVGFRATVCAFPAHGRAFFIAFNADVEGADYARIRALLVDALGVATPAPAAAAVPAADLDAWNSLYVPAPNRFESFAYLDRLFGVRRVEWRDGALQVRPLQGAPLRLEPAGGRRFRQAGRVLPSHALLVGDDGTRVLVDDNQTLARTGLSPLAVLWASLAAGVLGVAYVLLVGAWRLLRRRPWRSDALRVPWIGAVALLAPLPLFLRQPFLQFGDLTAASATLAVVTAALPAAMLVGLARTRQAPGGRQRTADAIALLAVLQWCAVLAAWGLLPLLTWAL
nr:beta-lactamase family protein [Lysobacter tabacisoli]